MVLAVVLVYVTLPKADMEHTQAHLVDVHLFIKEVQAAVVVIVLVAVVVLVI
jgi:hypothetical protein